MKRSSPAKSRRQISKSTSTLPSQAQIRRRSQGIQKSWTASERLERLIQPSSGKHYRVDQASTQTPLDPVFLAHLRFAQSLLHGLK